MRKISTKTVYHCRDCKHSHSYYEKNYKGVFFMCKCKMSKFSKMLSSRACDNFELKKDVIQTS